MKHLMELLKKKDALYHWLSALFGIILLVAIFMVMRNPAGRTELMLLVFSGGGLNIINGWRLYGRPKQRNQGMSMLLLGVIILFIGIYLLAVLGRS